MMNKLKTIYLCTIIEIMLIVCVTFANLYPAPLCYFFFYNILYGTICSFVIPLFLLRREDSIAEVIGLKVPGKRQVVVLTIFVAVSVGGQLIPIIINNGTIPWNLLPVGVVPLVMTTFFEEFLFRGFVQSRCEKDYGVVPAIFISGLMFSLYHIGYPRFRTFGNLFLLFAVGVGFAAAYKLSENNLVVAYFVNLPNAFVTYMLKFEQFPVMKVSSIIASIITLFIIMIISMVLRADVKKHW